MASLEYQFRVLARDEQEALAESIEHALAWGVGDRELLDEQLRELAALMLSRKRLTDSERERLQRRWGDYVQQSDLRRG